MFLSVILAVLSDLATHLLSGVNSGVVDHSFTECHLAGLACLLYPTAVLTELVFSPSTTANEAFNFFCELFHSLH